MTKVGDRITFVGADSAIPNQPQQKNAGRTQVNNEWIENTGTVPEGVTADTHIEVFLRDYGPMLWHVAFPTIRNDDPVLWTLGGDAFDIIRWRFV